MKLSVIIVNYNVRYFLEQALHSAKRALNDIDGEIIVVDNASTDDSPEMMAKKFPGIQYIYLQENVGFSKGNNIGITASKGEYVLLLNPDTVVAEDAFRLSIDFMDAHPEAGGLGVHMVDGNGCFLPESKRGLPTPRAAFFKIFGLSSLFPNSRIFGTYHLGYLKKEDLHEVDVLSGAYMLMRRQTLESCGLLDETFFMYGEDVDLSYRIVQAGYKNFYFPQARIIHYKGESTKKGSVNYVFVFYRAMVIFAKKHFDKGQASLFGFLIELAIYFRAALSLARRAFGQLWQVLIDAAILFVTFSIAKTGYAHYAQKDFDLPLIQSVIAGYTLLSVIGLFYGGAYDMPFKISRWFKGWVITTLVLLGFYSLLPESYRFSRAVLLIGILGGFTLSSAWRMLMHTVNASLFPIAQKSDPRMAIVGDGNSINRIVPLLESHHFTNDLIVGITAEPHSHYPVGYVGNIKELEKAIKDFSLTEVIFDTSAISNQAMIEAMETTSNFSVKYRMLVGNPAYLIGSQEVILPDDKVALGDLSKINLPAIKRIKRTTDLLACIALVIALPVLLLLVDEIKGLIHNIFDVIKGRATWVGYDPRGKHVALPALKKAVVYDLMNVIIPDDSQAQLVERNTKYIRHHQWYIDVGILLKHIHFLGNTPS